MSGVILIYSCEKHRYTRVPKYKLPKSNYNGWPVFYVFATPFLEKEYIFDGDILTLRCEDSYLHLAKKVFLGYKAVLETFPEAVGVLRCGDDLLFNESALNRFLDSLKSDYMGFFWGANSRIPMKPKAKRFFWGANVYLPTKLKVQSTFITDYYKTHLEDFQNPLHRLPSYQEVMKLTEIPKMQGASGVLTYCSRKSCTLLIENMQSVGWDVLTYDPTYGYIYIIEDITTACILSKYGIYATEYPMWTENRTNFDMGNFIALHTNEYK